MTPISGRAKLLKITLISGQNDVTCDAGIYQPGGIIVDKVTVPAGDPQLLDFTLTPGSVQPFQLSDTSAPFSSGLLSPGIYSVTETVPDGWDLTEAICSDGSLANAIDLGPGETVTVTFKNTKRGNIIVDKVTVPADSTDEFTINPSYAQNPLKMTDATPPADRTIASGNLFRLGNTSIRLGYRDNLQR